MSKKESIENKSPLVSILMTAFNREMLIADAIESVLMSGYQNWELLVLDDCSTDNTLKIAKEFEKKDKRIRVYANDKNLGQFANRNKIVSYASGKYLKYLDSDDIIYSFGLEVMVSSMEQFPEAVIGFTFNNYDNMTKLPIALSNKEAFEYHFFKADIFGIGPSGTIYRRDVFNKVQGFNSKYGVAADIELNFRMGIYGDTVLMQRDLIWWRQHSLQEFYKYKDEYLVKNYLIHTSLLNYSDLPISEFKKKQLLININTYCARKIILYFFKFKFIQLFDNLKYLKLPFSSFIFAAMPRLIRNRMALLLCNKILK